LFVQRNDLREKVRARGAFIQVMKFFINADMSSRVTSLGLAAFLVFAIPVAGSAQQTPIPNPAATVSPETAKSFDPVAETQMWLGTVPADKRAKSDAYFEGGYWLVLWNFLLTVAISILTSRRCHCRQPRQPVSPRRTSTSCAGPASEDCPWCTW